MATQLQGTSTQMNPVAGAFLHFCVLTAGAGDVNKEELV